MLDLAASQLIETRVQKLASDVILVPEGTPMIAVLENGVSVARPATGAANEIFIGIAITRSDIPTNVPLIEQLPIPASSPYTVPLTKSMAGSALGVSAIAADGSITPLTAGSPGANATEYSISNNVVTVNAAQAGKKLQLSYRYAISYSEALLRFSFNGFQPATSVIDTVGLCPTGELFVDNFDPASNWASFNGSTPIKLGAGIFTMGGNGSVVNAIVTQVPGINSPLLGIRLNAGN